MLAVTCQKLNFLICFRRSGLDIVENGVTIITDYLGRNSGEAFVQFSSQEAAKEALQRNRDVIGQRLDAHAETRTHSRLSDIFYFVAHWLPSVFADTSRYFPAELKKFIQGGRGILLRAALRRRTGGRPLRAASKPVRSFLRPCWGFSCRLEKRTTTATTFLFLVQYKIK